MISLVRFFLLVICFSVINCFSAHASSDSGQEITLAGRKTVYWAPADGHGKQPLILFSHGFGGCATQSTFLTEALAQDGYWVFAPDHDDNGCGQGIRAFFKRPDERFGQPENWSDSTYTDRANDLRNLLTALKKDPQFQNRIDFSRVGLMGHSLGGYTVLGLAGAWSSWKTSGFKAVLALSPYSQPFCTQNTIKNLSIPFMFQGGTRDFGITPGIKKAGGCYDQSPRPKYFVEFEGAGHFSFSDARTTGHEGIIIYAKAFLDHYVKGQSASQPLTQAGSDVSELEYDSELGRSEAAADNSDNGGLRARMRARLQSQ